MSSEFSTASSSSSEVSVHLLSSEIDHPPSFLIVLGHLYDSSTTSIGTLPKRTRIEHRGHTHSGYESNIERTPTERRRFKMSKEDQFHLFQSRGAIRAIVRVIITPTIQYRKTEQSNKALRTGQYHRLSILSSSYTYASSRTPYTRP